MTYELAGKLKDAGFPKNFSVLSFECGDDFPTLSELIEACGNSFGQLERINNWNTIEWYATNNIKDIETEICSTPEEAVARLWLALNK